MNCSKPRRQKQAETAAGAPAEPAPTGPAGRAHPAAGTTLVQDIADYRQDASDILAGRAILSDHLLIDRGFVSASPAGFLWVNPTSQTSLEAQVSQLLGPGVDLRFCVMRHDEAGTQFAQGSTWTGSRYWSASTIQPAPASGHFRPRRHVADGADHGRGRVADRGRLTGRGRVRRDRKSGRGRHNGPAEHQADLGWVLFRRRSDVDCGPPPQQLNTVTLYAVKAKSEDDARAFWTRSPAPRGRRCRGQRWATCSSIPGRRRW